MAVYPGRFSVLKISTAAASTALSAMIQVTGITPPQVTNPPIDITVLDSTWRAFIGSIPDGGTVAMSLIWDPANEDHERLAGLVTATTPEEYRIVFSTTTKTVFFSAIVTDFQPQEIVVDNVVRANASFKVSGAVTYTS